MQLVVVDTAQIQPYIFGSNRLRENVGASHLVAQATEAWALEAVRDSASKHNIKANDGLDPSQHIESGNLNAEVLYAGGGNFVVLFEGKDNGEDGAKRFTRALSRRVLTDAPGLQLVIVTRPFAWSNKLRVAVGEAFKKLEIEKQTRLLSAPLLGLGVTVMCQSTGLPASGVTPKIRDDPGYPASAEIHVKITAAGEADERLREYFPPGKGFDYPRDFDDLGGTKGEHSYIAVVHADGDGMAERIRKIGENEPDNRAYINALREFSEKLEEAAKTALTRSLEKLRAKITDVHAKKVIVHRVGEKLIARIELQRKDGDWMLPFRPIVFGGDDVTFVCDGRLGLSLTTEYLREFENQTAGLPDGKGKATSSAGIAIVKSHYPFARAYALADELCRSAKNYRRWVKQQQTEWDGGCLDWHFARSGLSGDIKTIRKREFTVALRSPLGATEGFLTLCPLTVDKNPCESQRTWQVVRNAVDVFQGDGWAGRRNKLKALRDALREGPDEVNWFLSKYELTGSLPEIQDYRNFATTGWWGQWCGYSDAMELSDWFIPL